MRILTITALTLALTACGSSGEPQQIGPDRYLMHSEVKNWAGGADVGIRMIMGHAKSFCAKQSREPKWENIHRSSYTPAFNAEEDYIEPSSRGTVDVEFRCMKTGYAGLREPEIALKAN